MKCVSEKCLEFTWSMKEKYPLLMKSFSLVLSHKIQKKRKNMLISTVINKNKVTPENNIVEETRKNNNKLKLGKVKRKY